MNRTVALAIMAIVALCGACNRDIDEFHFTGTVVDGELCSSSQIGYVIDIHTPDSIGNPFTSSGISCQNAVMAYRAPQILHYGDTIEGVAYLTESYAALNCFGVIDNDLPEIILLSIDKIHSSN
ncbi:MAG: hypothetical protein J6031_06105 [Bacteroidales bacterium]|nr:hypothetical protein [Bacteroidales bacterium]